MEATLLAEEVVEGASGELFIINGGLVRILDGVLYLCEFLSELSLAEDGNEVLEADEGVVEDGSELLEAGLFSFSVCFSFCSLTFFFSFLLLKSGLNLPLFSLSFLSFDDVLDFSRSSSLGLSCFLISAAFSVG